MKKQKDILEVSTNKGSSAGPAFKASTSSPTHKSVKHAKLDLHICLQEEEHQDKIRCSSSSGFANRVSKSKASGSNTCKAPKTMKRFLEKPTDDLEFSIEERIMQLTTKENIDTEAFYSPNCYKTRNQYAPPMQTELTEFTQIDLLQELVKKKLKDSPLITEISRTKANTRCPNRSNSNILRNIRTSVEVSADNSSNRASRKNLAVESQMKLLQMIEKYHVRKCSSTLSEFVTLFVDTAQRMSTAKFKLFKAIVQRSATTIQKMWRGYAIRQWVLPYLKLEWFLMQKVKALFMGWRVRKILQVPEINEQIMSIRQLDKAVKYLDRARNTRLLPANLADKLKKEKARKKAKLISSISDMEKTGKWVFYYKRASQYKRASTPVLLSSFLVSASNTPPHNFMTVATRGDNFSSYYTSDDIVSEAPSRMEISKALKEKLAEHQMAHTIHAQLEWSSTNESARNQSIRLTGGSCSPTKNNNSILVSEVTTARPHISDPQTHRSSITNSIKKTHFRKPSVSSIAEEFSEASLGTSEHPERIPLKDCSKRSGSFQRSVLLKGEGDEIPEEFQYRKIHSQFYVLKPRMKREKDRRVCKDNNRTVV